MPLRKKATKGKTKVKSTVVKQAQNVRQSVKVVIEAPKRRAPKRPAKPTQSDLLKGLMRAPEYTTFRDLTPTAPSTGYGQAPPQYPLKNDLYQQRLDQQENVGSVSGSLSIAPQGLLPAPPERPALPAPKEEEKKSSEDEEEIIIMPKNAQVSPITGADISKEERKKIKKEENAEEQRQRRAREKEAEAQRIKNLQEIEERRIRVEQKRKEKEAKEQKADAFRAKRLMRTAFGGLKTNAFPEIEIEGLSDF